MMSEFEIEHHKRSKGMTCNEAKLSLEIDRLRSENEELRGCLRNLLEAFECCMGDWENPEFYKEYTAARRLLENV